MKSKHVTLLMAMMFLVGCATVRPQFVDPTGRKLPNPSYTLQVIGDPMHIIFYYASFEEVKDVDGTMISKPTYQSFLKHHDFYANKVKAVTLVIEVNNPNETEYSLYETVDVKIRKGQTNTTEVQMGGEVNSSILPYRQFVYPLPFGENIREVDHHVSFYVNNMEVARIGPFRYNLIH